MAKLNNNLFIMVALVSSLIAASMIVAVSEFTIPPQPEPGFYKAMEKCSKKISVECGESVVKAVLEDQNMSKKCCFELVHRMGRICHEHLPWYLASHPKLGVNATHVFLRGPQVYNSCVLKVSSEI
ncbi:hypothetical protein like AT5G42567 [Hibiscus trionum]|uniref:Prolamin-like domain-containing protein n=1 Tax=Hibiscus trionum TaxID=183268 RepID=A0A9W7ITI6_HIBTR|nr:hypothetical protein like AT5G42567 [Hibiscus trionum]GMJ02357.1 hypothetical protein like AT5G42567 [Hibiscus trionum]GMJ02358.1 hypothetical protein like AT5G42567 [Hibiscus trionum]GMJ02359.1 hypothetical protein like AT5G42567 [Hibiscus trionum]GMJ02360.1 hypothetical protein like AT5G42567 [Hibiscus trionum]